MKKKRSLNTYMQELLLLGLMLAELVIFSNPYIILFRISMFISMGIIMFSKDIIDYDLSHNVDTDGIS